MRVFSEEVKKFTRKQKGVLVLFGLVVVQVLLWTQTVNVPSGATSTGNTPSPRANRGGRRARTACGGRTRATSSFGTLIGSSPGG